MRIWDISPKQLCRSHLLGEHRELHAIWSILLYNKKGYARHPETVRWKGKLKALYVLHELLAKEMLHRGYQHQSPLDFSFVTGSDKQNVFVDSYDKQVFLLRQKKCGCRV